MTDIQQLIHRLGYVARPAWFVTWPQAVLFVVERWSLLVVWWE